MKINEGFILKEIEGVGGETKYVVITVGKASEKIGGMITLNETLKDIWKLIEAGKTKDQIIDEMVISAKNQAFVACFYQTVQNVRAVVALIQHYVAPV